MCYVSHVLTVIFFTSSFGIQLDIKYNHSTKYDGQPSCSDWSIFQVSTNESREPERWSQVAAEQESVCCHELTSSQFSVNCQCYQSYHRAYHVDWRG